jgi:excisionase family DNA binding protein
MTNCRPTGATAPTGKAAGDELTRLVRLIARQAAHEALRAFTDGLEMRDGHPRVSFDPSTHQEESSPEADPSRDPAERWLSVALVAERLGVSEKWVRRKIESGELPVHRIGRLLRIGERGLAAFMAGASWQRRI